MITIKSNDNKYFKIEKEKLIKIEYFKKYLSDQYNDNKEIIELDYNSNIIDCFIDNIDDYKKNKIDKNIIIEYIYFLNYIGFDKNIINLLEFFNDYKSDIKYILEISNLYPQYNKIIQKKLNKYIFNKKELDELENIYQISNYELYFIIKDKEDKIKDVKLSIVFENINNLNKFDYDNIYGLKYTLKK